VDQICHYVLSWDKSNQERLFLGKNTNKKLWIQIAVEKCGEN
jgi:hypothetical protein